MRGNVPAVSAISVPRRGHGDRGSRRELTSMSASSLKGFSKGISRSDLVNDLLKRDIDLVEAVKE